MRLFPDRLESQQDSAAGYVVLTFRGQFACRPPNRLCDSLLIVCFVLAVLGRPGALVCIAKSPSACNLPNTGAICFCLITCRPLPSRLVELLRLVSSCCGPCSHACVHTSWLVSGRISPEVRTICQSLLCSINVAFVSNVNIAQDRGNATMQLFYIALNIAIITHCRCRMPMRILVRILKIPNLTLLASCILPTICASYLPSRSPDRYTARQRLPKPQNQPIAARLGRP